MKEILEMVPKEVWIWSGIGSVIVFFASIIILRIAITHMAEDYFMPNRVEDESLAARHPFWRAVGLIGKNLLGGLLVLVGLIQTVTPGQGLLTILMGLVLMNFPGKRKMELWLVRRKAIRKSLDWIRSHSGKPPLQIPEKEVKCETLTPKTNPA